MRGLGGSDSEPVVIEMTDDSAVLLVRAIGIALLPDMCSLDPDDIFTGAERSALTSMQAALREFSL